MKVTIIRNPDQLYFTSDLHLGHKNIIKYCDRPFHDVDHMNDVIIDNWNSVISDDDVVFILGDVAFGDKRDLEVYLARLSGRKILIQGNHDRDKNIPHHMFDIIYDGFANIFVKEEGEKDGQSITLCHFPMLSWLYSHKGAWNLFGHWHSGTVHKPEGKGPDDVEVAEYVNNEEIAYNKLRPTQYDVGVDGNDYTPVSYYDIKKIITRKINNEKKK
jgi:calcineurin-like phosphoesterase family protein